MAESTSRWSEGVVDRSHEHIVLLFGDPKTHNLEEWEPIALLSPPKGTVFHVQFLIDQQDPERRDQLAMVQRELDYYLMEREGWDPWQYAKYHCGTASNIDSLVHWYFRSGQPQAESEAPPARGAT